MTTAPANKNEYRAVLYFEGGKNGNEAIKLRRDATIFGREKGDIVIDDHEISSSHFQVQNVEGTYYIFDMNSTNGTFVNNERVVRAKLSPGDKIKVGKTLFRFAIEKEATVRHISTIFKSSQFNKYASSPRTSVIDTIIENELNESKKLGLLIRVKYRNGAQEEIRLTQNPAYIGRASSFGEFDKDSEISRKHLKIKINDSGEIFIEDLNSTNGSFINGEKIHGIHPVNPGDEVKVGFSLIWISTYDQ